MKTLNVTILRANGAEEKAQAIVHDNGSVEFLEGLHLEPGDAWGFSLPAKDTLAWLGLQAPTMHVSEGLVARICTSCGEPFADTFEGRVMNRSVCPECGKKEAP